MQSKIVLTTALVFITGMVACEKSNSNCELVAAKVIRYDCDRVIFQLMADGMIGDAAWTDVTTGKQYSNVVSCANTCGIATLTNGQLVTIYAKPVKAGIAPLTGSCNQCLAISPAPPQTQVDFTAMEKEPCAADK